MVIVGGKRRCPRTPRISGEAEGCRRVLWATGQSGAAMTKQTDTTFPQKDFRTFVNVFEALEAFEAQSRLVRGYGAFAEHELPFEEVQRVIAWMKALMI
jgi:hypothetical protein